MATIKAIESRSVHQIQSGQVIVDLCSVVKELVENGLDAGATSIEVRFKNHGLDSIEVQDNGKGISPGDYETLALKHYTSKLFSYEDLTSLETFGFRGEALSSLCAVSKFRVLTARQEDGAVGKKLDFEVSGKLKGTSVVAAPRGTTVVVEDLFHTLPVRRKELEKNIKREYGKVINLLHAYACISVGVRYAVTNQVQKGKKVAVFSTKPNTTTKENIVNVYGAKTLLQLVKLDLKLEMQPSNGPSTQTLRNWSTQATDHSKEVQVQGHISKPIFGEGRQAPDRQMFFVNSRPCGLPQVSKAFNEVYKSFNVSQSPFIFANLIMDTNAYDVNVSPDKRNIMLHDQTALLDQLKTALTELFEHTDNTVPQSTLPNRKLPSYQPLTLPKRSSTEACGVEANDEASECEAEDEPLVAGSSNPVVNRLQARASATPVNLIESWAGRDSAPRKARPATVPGKSGLNDKRRSSDVSGDNEDQISKKSNLPVPFLEESNSESDDQVGSGMPQQDSHLRDGKQAALGVGWTSVLNQPDPMSTPYGDLFSQRLPDPPTRVQDFNAMIERKRSAAKDEEAAAEDAQSVSEGEGETHSEQKETPIHAILQATSKAIPGPVPNAFDRMRPKRTPLQTAEITVGDQTTTTHIGSSSTYKKRRVHEPINSQAIAAFDCSPLLARGLRGFAAPGTQMDIDSSSLPPDTTAGVTMDEGSEEIVETDEEEERMPDAPMVALGPTDPRMSTQNQPGTKQKAFSSDTATSDALDDELLAVPEDDGRDEDYLDETEKKIREDEKIARMIQEAELAAAQPTSQSLQRASQVLKNSANRKDATLQLSCTLTVSVGEIRQEAASLRDVIATVRKTSDASDDTAVVKDELDATQAESKLSLTVSKPDFSRMLITGQFNLGFVLAVRPATTTSHQDELFIIDQHAADEKYNYERFQRTVTLQSQRLVRPKTLDLTAVEEELLLTHASALKANGFEIESIQPNTSDNDIAETRTFRLLTLPISHTTTFDLADLSELLYLLSETPTSSTVIPRPKKVQRMLAMRACRSSIMVGKVLTMRQMESVVRHMGEMEKPWNCPHGRPTMRHLAGLGEWGGWHEGDAVDEEEGIPGTTDWKAWLEERR